MRVFHWSDKGDKLQLCRGSDQCTRWTDRLPLRVSLFLRVLVHPQGHLDTGNPPDHDGLRPGSDPCSCLYRPLCMLRTSQGLWASLGVEKAAHHQRQRARDGPGGFPVFGKAVRPAAGPFQVSSLEYRYRRNLGPRASPCPLVPCRTPRRRNRRGLPWRSRRVGCPARVSVHHLRDIRLPDRIPAIASKEAHP